MEQPLQEKKNLVLVGGFSFSKTGLQVLCRGFYPGFLHWR